MTVLDWFSGAAVCLGVLFFWAGTIGLIRLPEALSRLHALTKADNLGLGLLVLGLLPLAADAWAAAKLLLIWVAVLAAGATGAHLIARKTLEVEGATLDDSDRRCAPDRSPTGEPGPAGPAPGGPPA